MGDKTEVRADGLEVKEVSQAAKTKASILIQEAEKAIAIRNSFVEGIASELEIEGKWTFDFGLLAFTRQIEKKSDGPSI